MGLRLAYRSAALAAGLLCLSSLVRAQANLPLAPAPEAPVLDPPLTPQTPAAPPQTGHGPVALHWVRLPGSEGCVGGDELARAVEDKLQRPVFPLPRDAEILIEGRVEPAGGGYRAELRMLASDGRLLGSRSLSAPGPDCGELSETLSVVLAVMIDPDAEGRARPPEPPPAPPNAPLPAQPRPFPDDNRLLSFGRVLVNVTPAVGYGIGAAYERALGVAGGLRLEIVSFIEQTSARSITGSPDASLDLRLTTAGLAYCPLWLSSERARLAGCAGLELGAVNTRSANLSEPVSDRALWISGSAALRLSVRLVSALELHLAAAFVATGERTYWVTVTGADPSPKQEWIARSDAFGAAFDLGLGARF